MRYQNKISRKNYIVCVLIAGAVSMLLYALLCRNLSEKESSMFSYNVFIGLMTAVGIYITSKRRRSISSAVRLVLIPYGIIFFFNFTSTSAYIALGLWIALTAVAAIEIFKKHIPKSRRTILVLWVRLKKLVIISHSVLGYAAAALVIITLINRGLIIPMNHSAQKECDSCSLNFTLDDWNKGDVLERTEYATELIRYESVKLNIPMPKFEVNMHMKENHNGSICGNTVILNRLLFEGDSFEKLAKTICHECYHLFEKHLLNITLKTGDTNDIKIDIKSSVYKDEFDNYHFYRDSRDDFNKYYYQQCEIDARIYANIEYPIIYHTLVTNNYYSE